MEQYSYQEFLGGKEDPDPHGNNDFISNLEFQHKNLDKEILEINKKRKFQQTKVQEEIVNKHYKTQELIQKNILLEQEILKLKESKDGVVQSKRQKLE